MAPPNRLYLVFLRKDVYSREEAQRYSKICEDPFVWEDFVDAWNNSQISDIIPTDWVEWGLYFSPF